MTPRREFLTACGGLALAASPSVASAVASAETVDPHIAWWAEERRLYAAMEATEGDELDRLNDQRWDIRNLIIATPAGTVAGMAVQVRLMSLWDEEGLEVGSDLYEMLAPIADNLDHMARRA